MDSERAPALAFAVGLGVAIASLPLAAAAGAPYVDSDSVNPWVVVFAVGLGVVLGALPFAIERRMRARVPEGDRRWERALLAWGAAALGVLLAGFLLGVAGEWSSSTSLVAAVGLLATIESALVLATMIVWLLSG